MAFALGMRNAGVNDRSARGLAFVLVALAHGCACPGGSEPPTPVAVIQDNGECLLGVDNPSGVAGMDGASSIALDSERTLFVFGDTFFGTVTSSRRELNGGIDNSAMVVRNADRGNCFAGTPFLGGSKATRVLQRPSSADADDRYWPTWGAAEGDKLWLFYAHTRADPSAGFGFRTAGHGVATGSVSATQVSPPAVELPPSEPLLGSAFLIHQGFAYIWRCGPGGEMGGGFYPCKLARTEATRAADPSTYSYFVSGQGFTGSLQQASLVMEGAPDFTVTFNARLNQLLMVYIEPFAKQVSVRTAPAPEGPWTDKRDIHPCTLTGTDSFCYAGKQHVSLSAADGEDIVITYNTNTTGGFDVVKENPTLYWPRMFTFAVSSLSP